MTHTDELLIDNYITLMWGEFNNIRKNGFKIAPLILSFSIIEASAKLASPDDNWGSQKRFLWWVDKFLTHSDGTQYNSFNLYGARCGLFHEYGVESDLSRQGKCKIIVWTTGDDRNHNKENTDMIILSQERFFKDLGEAGLKQIQELKTDINMQQRFAKRLPKIFGAKTYEV